MRAFVTGATGFIGGRLARALRERGDEVVGARPLAGARRATAALGCELVEGDLDADDAIAPRARRLRRRLPRRRRLPHRDPGATRCTRCARVNVGGTERVLDAAADAGVGARRPRLDRERRSGTRAARSSTRRYERPAGRLRLRVRRDEAARAPRRRGARPERRADRDRAARRRLRPRRHVAARRPDPRRRSAGSSAIVSFPTLGGQRRPRRRRRRRAAARPRPRPDGRELRPRRRARRACGS